MGVTGLDLINLVKESKIVELDLGIYNEEGRDPRYWTYRYNGKTFGMKRGSSSHGYVLYIITDKYKDVISKLSNAAVDINEVAGKWWMDITQVLDINDDEWMIIDHKNIVKAANEKIKLYHDLRQFAKEINTEDLIKAIKEFKSSENK